MKPISFLTACFLATFNLINANTVFLNNSIINTQTNEDEIVATITKDTSEKQFDELVSYFNEHGINLNLSKIEYNENNEITSIKISLAKGKQQSNFGLSQNMPIANIELGLKNGILFIETKNGSSINIQSFGNLFDQLNTENPFADLFDNESFTFNFDSEMLEEFMHNDLQNFDLNKLRDQFLNGYEADKQNKNAGIPTYNFINKPGIEKLIIIDGNESNFETLNRLAKQNKLADVDNLKASTAVSIYGQKAKDGAIIATTKK